MKFNLVKTQALKKEICYSLGFNPSMVQSLTLNLVAGEVVTVSVTQYVKVTSLEKLSSTLKMFEIGIIEHENKDNSTQR